MKAGRRRSPARRRGGEGRGQGPAAVGSVAHMHKLQPRRLAARDTLFVGLCAMWPDPDDRRLRSRLTSSRRGPSSRPQPAPSLACSCLYIVYTLSSSLFLCLSACQSLPLPVRLPTGELLNASHHLGASDLHDVPSNVCNHSTIYRHSRFPNRLLAPINPASPSAPSQLVPPPQVSF